MVLFLIKHIYEWVHYDHNKYPSIEFVVAYKKGFIVATNATWKVILKPRRFGIYRLTWEGFQNGWKFNVEIKPCFLIKICL